MTMTRPDTPHHTLFLMRHAKTEGYNELGDKARGLTSRGRDQAGDAGLELAGRGVDLVLCSTSTRTRQTLAALGLKLPNGEPVPVQYMDALYLGSSDVLRQRISEIEEDVANLLVIGHSPAIPTLSAELAWATSHREADQMQCSFPTSTVSEFVIEGPWAVFDAGIPEKPRLAAIWRPRKQHPDSGAL